MDGRVWGKNFRARTERLSAAAPAVSAQREERNFVARDIIDGIMKRLAIIVPVSFPKLPITQLRFRSQIDRQP